MTTEATAVGKTAVVPEPVRTVRISGEDWEALQDALLTRREGESTQEFRDRLKDGASGPLRLAARAYAADPLAFEAACRRIVGES